MKTELFEPESEPMTVEPTTTLVPVGTALPSTLAAELEQAADLIREDKAKGTRRLYSTDFRIFGEWCRPRGASALPATPSQ